MSLPILVALVVVGIALVVAAVHFTGGSKVLHIQDADHAAKLFASDFPNERPGRAELTTDRQSAFLVLDSQRIGVVQSFGDGYLTRIVTAADVASVRFREPALVSIRFKDFTWTGGHFTLADAAAAARIAGQLGAVSSNPGA